MSCAPFRVERAQVHLPEFPAVKRCQALREHETHPDCVCRAYPARGYYVFGACGHAHGWDFKREDADAQCERLNLRCEVEDLAMQESERRATAQGWVP